MSTSQATKPSFIKTKTPGVYFKETQAGRTYYIDYKDDSNRRRRERVAGGYQDAIDALAKITTKRSGGESIPGRVDKTYAEFSNECIDRRTVGAKPRLKPQSATVYRASNDLYVIPVIGHKNLAKITKHDILRVITKMQEKGYSGGTINGAVKIMSMTLGDAEWTYGIPNYVKQIRTEDRPSGGSEKTMHLLEREEIGDLIEAASKMRTLPLRSVALLYLGIYSGMRQSELCGLWWEDLDLRGAVPTVRVHSQLARANGEAPTRLGYLKARTAGESRTIEIPVTIARKLMEWKMASTNSGDEDYVFANADGSPLNQSSARYIFVASRDKAYIQAKLPAKQRCSFHDMRHTFASMLIAGNADIIEVQLALGHKKSSITLDIYTHLWGKDQRVGKLGTILEAAI